MTTPGLGVCWTTGASEREDVVGTGPNVAGDDDINAEEEGAEDTGPLGCV
jgi:hypothetical protein